METPYNRERLTPVEWFDYQEQVLSDKFWSADMEHAEALDAADSKTRFRTERAMDVIRERQLHLHELRSMLSDLTYPATALKQHRESLLTRLSAQNRLSSQLEGHVDLRGSFKAGTEAEKLRGIISDTEGLLALLDK